MKFKFQLPDFPKSNFEIQTSVWTGKSILTKDNVIVEQSTEKGKPFLIPNGNGEVIKAFPKPTLPDFVPSLEINGKKNPVAKKLSIIQYIVGGLPALLVVGGAIGGGIGFLAAFINFNLFRQEGTEISKYLKVLGVIVLAYILYSVIAGFLVGLLA